MKLFKTNNKEVIKACQEYFCFRLPSDLIERNKEEQNSIRNVIIIQTCHVGVLIAVNHGIQQ